MAKICSSGTGLPHFLRFNSVASIPFLYTIMIFLTFVQLGKLSSCSRFDSVIHVKGWLIFFLISCCSFNCFISYIKTSRRTDMKCENARVNDLRFDGSYKQANKLSTLHDNFAILYFKCVD